MLNCKFVKLLIAKRIAQGTQRKPEEGGKVARLQGYKVLFLLTAFFVWCLDPFVLCLPRYSRPTTFSNCLFQFSYAA